MSLILHWWHLPIVLAIVGAILITRTKIIGNTFQWPTWHFGVGCLLIFAAVCMTIGGLLTV